MFSSEVKVSENVIVSVVKIALEDFKNIKLAKTGLPWENQKPIKLLKTESGVSIDVAIGVDFGTKSLELAKVLQNKIRCAVQNFCNVTLESVNIHVSTVFDVR